MNRTTTIVLLVVAAALGLYVLVVQNPKDKAAAEATPTAAASTPKMLWTTTADQIVRLRVAQPASGRGIAVAKDASGAWTVTEPIPGAADANRLLMLTGNVASLSVTSELTGTADVAAFGVLEPTYTLEVGLADGQTLKAVVGNKAPVGGAYYVQREGDTSVVVVPGTGLDALFELLTTPPYAPTATPPPTSVDLTPGTGTVAP